MTGRVLIIGPKDADMDALLEYVKKESHFIPRLVDLSDINEEAILAFKPDIIIFNAGASPETAIKFFDRFMKLDSLKDLPCLIAVEEDKIISASNSLPMGVADIVAKPIRPFEVVAKMQLLYRKTHRISDTSIIRSAELEIDISKYEVRVSGKKVDLTYTEYELLKFLASNPGQVFGRDLLLNKVWGYDYFGGARTVDVHVRRLRSKLETNTGRYIETIRHIGYKFVHEEE
ncbi:MAG: DNA-binding response OmpR family regulator [Candidatus Omnitrophota bacterium]|jgi:DNA-binding response OmpR family regulator